MGGCCYGFALKYDPSGEGIILRIVNPQKKMAILSFSKKGVPGVKLKSSTGRNSVRMREVTSN